MQPLLLGSPRIIRSMNILWKLSHYTRFLLEAYSDVSFWLALDGEVTHK